MKAFPPYLYVPKLCAIQSCCWAAVDGIRNDDPDESEPNDLMTMIVLDWMEEGFGI